MRKAADVLGSVEAQFDVGTVLGRCAWWEELDQVNSTLQQGVPIAAEELPVAVSPIDGHWTEGRAQFDKACATCHVGGSGTDNNSGKLHAPGETGVDGAYAARTANKAYRTTPLRGLWQHPPYFHDGSAATLMDVVAHYNRVRTLGLTAEQQGDLVEYLKSL